MPKPRQPRPAKVLTTRARALRWLTAGLVILAGGCSTTLPRDESAWSQAQQLVLVTTADWDASQGTLRSFERTAAGWRPTMPAAAVTVGRAGSAWGIGLHTSLHPTGLHPAQSGPVKREGDGRAPAGVFRIGTAFGYGAAATTALPYAAMRASDYCIDVSASPLYNRIVDADKVGLAAVAGSTEPMRRDIHVDGDQRYKLGFVIEHNGAGVAEAGSCIFAHLWKAPGKPTAGCTAMDEAVMKQLLAWLRPEQQPVFVLLPVSEHTRLQVAWGLPDLTPASSADDASNSPSN